MFLLEEATARCGLDTVRSWQLFYATFMVVLVGGILIATSFGGSNRRPPDDVAGW